MRFEFIPKLNISYFLPIRMKTVLRLRSVTFNVSTEVASTVGVKIIMRKTTNEFRFEKRMVRAIRYEYVYHSYGLCLWCHYENVYVPRDQKRFRHVSHSIKIIILPWNTGSILAYTLLRCTYTSKRAVTFIYRTPSNRNINGIRWWTWTQFYVPKDTQIQIVCTRRGPFEIAGKVRMLHRLSDDNRPFRVRAKRKRAHCWVDESAYIFVF